jgi:hypothetical protein
MRGIAVTVEALSFPSSFKNCVRHAGTIAKERSMAAEAVFLHYPFACFPDIYYLRFFAHGKNS